MKNSYESILFDQFEPDELLRVFLQQKNRLILYANKNLEVCALNEIAKHFFYLSPTQIPVNLITLFSDIDLQAYFIRMEDSGLNKFSFKLNRSENLCFSGMLWTIIRANHCPGVEYVLFSEEKTDVVDEHYLGAILTKLPGSFYWKSREGVYLGCSQLVADMAGVASPAEVIGKDDYQLHWKESADLVRKNDAWVINTEMPVEAEEVVKFPDGSERMFFVNKQPLRNASGQVVGVIGTSLDITEKKQLEASLHESQIREKAFKANATLGGMIAHELRTPLSSMKYAVSALADYLPILIEGYQYWSQKEKINKIRKDHLKALEKSIGQLERAINYSSVTITTVLATFRPDNAELVNEAFNASSVVKNCVNDFIVDKSQSITYDIEENLYALGEPAIIEHVLYNLLKNAHYAIHVARQGNIKVTLIQESGQILLRVFDTGKGIPPDTIEKIFEPFFTTKDDNSSIGIGLYFCKMAIEKMKGQIDCRSELGKFTEFTVFFPQR